MERSATSGLVALAISDMLFCISVIPNTFVGTEAFRLVVLQRVLDGCDEGGMGFQVDGGSGGFNGGSCRGGMGEVGWDGFGG